MNDPVTQDPAGNDAGLDKVMAACTDKLPPPTAWSAFPGYPGSLALAVIDAIWSVGIRYTTPEGVVARYTAYRRMTGDDAAHDTVTDLLRSYASLGGAEGFIDRIGTRHRVSTQPSAALDASPSCKPRSWNTPPPTTSTPS
jgi:hypothetical protein